MPYGRPSRQLSLVTAALVAVAGLSVAACSRVGDGGSSPASASASPTASAATATRPPAPLTGLPASSAAAAGKPAVAVDLGGTDPAGLGSADVVFQEFSTPVRYVAVYQSRQADAGPVASTQPSDVEVLSVLHPLLGYDGAAAPYFVTSLDKSKVKDAGYGSHPSFYTTGAQGLTASTSTIASGISGDTAPPPLFAYRGASTGASTLATTGVSRPTGVQITIRGQGTEEWSFDQGADLWKQTSGGPAAEVANLIVQMVPYKTIGVNAKAGITMQSAQVIGSGKVEVLSASAAGGTGGTVAAGTWSKPHFGEITNYLDSSGAPMDLQPGPTWVLLAPPGTQVSTSG
jgi:hypothetical protein